MDENPFDTIGSPYCGMTINERLFAAKLLDAWDAAVRCRDRATMIRLLVKTDLPKASAIRTTDATLAKRRFWSRWFTFRLRTLFVVVVALALPLAWVGRSYSVVQERRAYRGNFDKHEFSLRRIGVYQPTDEASIPWIRELMGDFALRTLLYEPEADQDGSQLQTTRELFPEANIWGWPGAKDLPAGMKPFDPNRIFEI